MTTMDDLYGDGTDHEACPVCGECKTCGDCDCTAQVATCQQPPSEPHQTISSVKDLPSIPESFMQYWPESSRQWGWEFHCVVNGKLK